MSENYHIPVMLNECIEYLNIKKDGVYCDFTLGGGGHFWAIAEKLGEDGVAVGIDRDLTAVNRITTPSGDNAPATPSQKGNLQSCKFVKVASAKNINSPSFEGVAGVLSPDGVVKCGIIVEHSSFSAFDGVLRKHNIDGIDGILMDLGVSSHQFDEGGRGFSYRSDAKLDMRMNRDDTKTAADLINFESESELTRILGDFGEVRNPQRMARTVVAARKSKPLETTGELLTVLNSEYGHLDMGVLSKIFQAFRIAVNGELDELQVALDKSLGYLRAGGRIVVMSYHSLEDRIVKNFLRDNARDCVCPRVLPKCVCGGNSAKLRVITKKAIEANEDEVLHNRRARSAKLRCGEKV